MYKVLLYYGFTPLADPEAIRLWQRDLCESLGLAGRILISPHGINATVGGELNALKKYWRKTREYPRFKEIDFKWSESSAESQFPRLSVRAWGRLFRHSNFGSGRDVLGKLELIIDYVHSLSDGAGVWLPLTIFMRVRS